MKPYFKYYGICWAILFLAFQAITFTAAGATVGLAALRPAFWISYTFINLVFIGNLVCSIFFFRSDHTDRIFLRYPVVKLSFTALVVSVIAGALVMAVPVIPYWIGVVIDVCIFTYYAVAIVKSTAAAEVVEQKGQQIKEQTAFIKSLTVDAEVLMDQCKTPQTKALAEKVYTAVRYSDPMSTPALQQADSQIQAAFSAFSAAVHSGDTLSAQSAADTVLAQIDARNKKCKALK